jgi:Ca2+-transporting ATPase
MEASLRGRVEVAVLKMAQNGFRVLAVARGGGAGWESAQSLNDFNFELVGLLGYYDPLKPGVKESVQQCHEAGISVMMITGDYPATALAIARDCGIMDYAGVLTGDDIALLAEQELIARLKSVRVLARMVPDQKLRIVKALQASGEVVAMTGDGINDAPALKAAHIGIAMGSRGSDVAREASALVLLDDNFTSIVAAVRLGRRIYDNIQKAVIYIIAIHIPIVGITLVPLTLGIPAILWPVHLAFLEIIIDPVCSIVFEAEPEDPTIMNRRPRALSAKLFSRKVVGTSFFEGIIALSAVLLVFMWIGRSGEHPDHARAVAFTSLVFINMALIFSIRAGSDGFFRSLQRTNLALGWVGGALLGLSAMVLFVPAVARLFQFSRPHFFDLLSCAGIALAILAVIELMKHLVQKKRRD